MALDVYSSLTALFADTATPVRRIEHPPVTGAEDAARFRGLPPAMGAKSLVLKVDGTFRLFALGGDRKLRTRSLRRALGVRRTRFASAAELRDLTGLTPGTVPPFGPPVLPLPLYVDADLVDRGELAFTPGRATESWIVGVTDYLELAGPQVLELADPL